ncbi:MAG: hypothetical protein WDM90_12110 [Ferruginibacter sp.]
MREGLNRPEQDNKQFNYDITVGYNRSHFAITHHPYFFRQQDSVLSIESINSAGFNFAFLVEKDWGSILILEQLYLTWRLKKEHLSTS